MTHSPKWVVGFLALLIQCASWRAPAAPDSANASPDKFSVASPDGRFIFRQTMESEDGDAAFGVFDARTKRSVLIDPGASLPPMEDSIACLWAPDSKRFAINGRVSGRCETTELFEWTGRQFQHVHFIEDTLTDRLAEDRNEQLKKAGIPASLALRRVWDLCKALKWEDADTLAVLGSSTRSYVWKKDSEDAAQVVSAFIFTIKLEKSGRPKIIAERAPFQEESRR